MYLSDFTLQNTDQINQLTKKEFKKCIAQFLYTLKNPKQKIVPGQAAES